MNDSPLVPEHIRLAIEAACEGAGVSLIDLGVRGKHRQMRMEISIDAPDGITHEHCRAVSRGIDARLNEDEYFGRFHAVDVSSPGAETPVRFLWQLQKHVGRNVRIQQHDGSVVQGKLVGVSGGGLDVQPTIKERSAQPAPVISIPANAILEARTVVSL